MISEVEKISRFHILPTGAALYSVPSTRPIAIGNLSFAPTQETFDLGAVRGRFSSREVVDTLASSLSDTKSFVLRRDVRMVWKPHKPYIEQVPSEDSTVIVSEFSGSSDNIIVNKTSSTSSAVKEL
ncbi:MAG TPA: hypothetical protein VMU77_00185 [Acidimicrobiales bacterium]|nr:hypothetical protein [Acidimicrobiales bacterium]